MSLIDQYYSFDLNAAEKEDFAAELSAWEDMACAPPPEEQAGGGYGGGGGDLYERNEYWRRTKEANTEQLRKATQEARNSECTFHPQINTSTVGRRDSATWDRLYQQSREPKVSHMQHVYDQREEENLTFVPKTTRSAWTSQVAPRYLDPQARHNTSGASVDSSECTFMPAVNHHAQSDNVNRYLSLPVYDRLSRSARQRHAPQHDNQSRRLTEEEQASFAARMSQSLATKEKNLMKIKRTLTETESQGAAPKVAPGSRNIPVKGNIRSRSVKTMANREAAAKKHELEANQKLTFTPTVHPSPSGNHRRKNAYMMNVRCKSPAAAKERREQLEEERECTFHPQTSAAGGKGKLNSALQSSAAYRQYLQNQKLAKQVDVDFWEREKEEKDTEECTFQPVIHEVPPAVRAIAHSMSTSRADTSRDSGARHSHHSPTPSFRF